MINILNNNDGKKDTKNAKPSKRREVDQYDLSGNLINTFKSLIEASEQTGSNIISICLCCRGKRKSANGFVFKYNNSNQIIKASKSEKQYFNIDFIE